jgi:hypothetical protein
LAGHLACKPDRTSSTLAGYRFRSTVPLDTTRGIMKALWLTGDPQDKNNKIWMHPERSQCNAMGKVAGKEPAQFLFTSRCARTPQACQGNVESTNARQIAGGFYSGTKRSS